MEAELVSELPEGDGWQYEPKWDGFRGVLENDGGELALWSRKERPLLRYFPELRPLGDLLPPHSALDGEIVIARDGVLDFELMQMRLHPAQSRVNKLAAEIPAEFIAFDVLLWKGKPVHELPLAKRRKELEKVGQGLPAVAGDDRPRPGARLARHLRGRGARRRDRQAARPPVPPGLARGGREGQAVQDRGLRRRRRALEVEADAPRDAAPRAVPRRRRDRLRRAPRPSARRSTPRSSSS